MLEQIGRRVHFPSAGTVGAVFAFAVQSTEIRSLPLDELVLLDIEQEESLQRESSG